MSGDPTDDTRRRARERLAAASMSPDRPLDALLPALREPTVPRAAVHPRVLEVDTPAGFEWLLLVWEDPGGPQQLHQQVQALVEATLLAELSRPPSTVRSQGARRIAGLRLVFLAELGWDVLPAIRAFGFRADDGAIDDATRGAIADEARRSERPVVEPSSSWTARILAQAGALGDKIRDIDRMMADKLGDETWGTTPGSFSHLFAGYVRKVFGEAVGPNLEGLQAVDMLVIQREADVIRWIPPMIFQALCDLLPVVASAAYGARISWAQSDDLGDGFAHPPLLRVEDGGSGVHIPIGHHVLRWWMMPLFPGEQVPTPAEWLEDQFGPGDPS